MDLRDRHLIVNEGGRYSVRAANLPSVAAEVDGEGVRTPMRRTSATRQKTKEPASASEKAGEPGKAASAGRRRAGNGGKSGSQTARFKAWIDEGYFDQTRTLSDVAKKFRQSGIIIARTSIPQLLLKAVRTGRLTREEAEVAGKNAWVYGTAK